MVHAQATTAQNGHPAGMPLGKCPPGKIWCLDTDFWTVIDDPLNADLPLEKAVHQAGFGHGLPFGRDVDHLRVTVYPERSSKYPDRFLVVIWFGDDPIPMLVIGLPTMLKLMARLHPLLSLAAIEDVHAVYSE